MMNNLKMVKVNENSYMLCAVKFTLYQVVLQPKLKLKLVEEVLAWNYSAHNRLLLTNHAYKRTEILLAN